MQKSLSNSNVDDAGTVLDLGLSALVSEPAIEETQSNIIAPSVDLNLVESSTSPSELERLISSQNWSELIALCESRSLHSANDNQTQLAWALGSLHVGEMPANLIAGPVDSVARELLLNKDSAPKELVGLAASVLRECAKQLIKSNNLFLAAQQLNLAYALDGQQSSHLKEVLETAIKALDGAENNSKTSKRELQAQREALALMMLEIKQVNNADTLAVQSAKASAEVALKSENLLEQSVNADDIGQRRFASGFKFSPALVTALSALTLMVGYFYLPLHLSFKTDSDLSIAETGLDFGSPPELMPVIDDRLGKHSHLDAVLYELEQRSGADKNSAHNVTALTSVAPPSLPAVTHVALSDKQSVNTSTPRESERGRYDRELGVRESIVSAAADRLYSIVADSEVLKKPEFNSNSIALLRRGDRVVVQGREGDWLRLRSKRGQVGYIYAQDAEPFSAARR